MLQEQSAEIISKADNRLAKHHEFEQLTLEGKINDEMIKTFRDN